ncbi:unnamed protein product [Microthlaspi erraticum]|uniref:Uncharacterized protein n=1 Tax=Microthlaspi erraticum TaxID=1685480 RepID=A0A6D2L251_9BRAS|nr:unnamed protein product [Microthlaspi erraticum]
MWWNATVVYDEVKKSSRSNSSTKDSSRVEQSTSSIEFSGNRVTELDRAQPRNDLRNKGLASENQTLEAIGSLPKLIHPTPMNSISRARVVGALSGYFPAISITSMWRIA